MLILFLVVLAVAAAAFGLSRARGGSSGYGGSVDQVKSWVNTACQNHNTAWPGDVNFACDTKQGKNILWVFALMSSNSNPDYAGKPAAKGQEARVGLLPVPPTGAAQHYVPALGLDHVYNPKNPIDSLQVGALILNTDVGGTVNFGGVQGLESNPNNCVRYTGSAQQTTLASGLKICTQNLTPQGQQSLVEDLWLRWNIPGSDQAAQKEASTAAQCAAVLYSSPDSPNANAQAALTWIEKEHQKGKLLV